MLSANGVAAGEALGVVTSTHSNSHWMPSGSSTPATKALTSSCVMPGRMRQSTHASARVGITLTAVPASSTVGVKVAPSKRFDEAGDHGVERAQLGAGRARCGRVLEPRGQRPGPARGRR